jgi:hypothetical protein
MNGYSPMNQTVGYVTFGIQYNLPGISLPDITPAPIGRSMVCTLSKNGMVYEGSIKGGGMGLRSRETFFLFTGSLTNS